MSIFDEFNEIIANPFFRVNTNAQKEHFQSNALMREFILVQFSENAIHSNYFACETRVVSLER